MRLVWISFNWLSMWVTESRRWAGRRVGGEVPVIDKGVGGDTAGTDRSDSAVFKFNRAKWGKFKESNII